MSKKGQISNEFQYHDKVYGLVLEENIDFLVDEIVPVFGESSSPGQNKDRGTAWNMYNAASDALEQLEKRFGEELYVIDADLTTEELADIYIEKGMGIELREYEDVYGGGEELGTSPPKVAMLGDSQVGHAITPADIVLSFVREVDKRQDDLIEQFNREHPQGDMPDYEYSVARSDYVNSVLTQEYGNIHNKDDINHLKEAIAKHAAELFERSSEKQISAEHIHQDHQNSEREAQTNRQLDEIERKLKEMQERTARQAQEREERARRLDAKIREARERAERSLEQTRKRLEKKPGPKKLSPAMRLRVERFKESEEGRTAHRKAVTRTAWALLRAQQMKALKNGEDITKIRPGRKEYELAKRLVDKVADRTTSTVQYNRVADDTFKTCMEIVDPDYKKPYTLAIKDIKKGMDERKKSEQSLEQAPKEAQQEQARQEDSERKRRRDDKDNNPER